MLRFDHFLVFLIIFHTYWIHAFGKGGPVQILQSNLIQFSNGGIRVGFSDIDHVYDEVQINGDFKCLNTTGYVNTSYGLSKNLIYYEVTKEWLYENLTIPYCPGGRFNYELIAYRQLDDIPNRLRRYAQGYGEEKTSNKNGGLLGGGSLLNLGVLGGAVNLDLLGDKNSNDHSQSAQDTTQTKKDQQCEYSKTTINYDKKVCKQELIFEDDFNEMNWTKWDYDVRMPLDTEDADFVSFQNLEKNLYIKDGNLYILPKLLTELPEYDDDSIQRGTLNLGANCTGTVDRSSECKRESFAFRILPPVVSARIRTKNKFTFKYGIIEIKAKLPKGDWLFPQLFLEPSVNHYGISGYSSGQIRLAFIRSNEILDSKEGRQIDGYRLFGGVVLSPDEQYRELWMKDLLRKRNHFGDDYHVYKTIWTDEFISFHVDGTEYGSLKGNFGYEAFDLNKIQHAEYWKTGNKVAPFDKEFFLSFGVSAGGISDFPDSSSSGRRESDKKPWINTDAKNELNFWRARDRWHSTWNGEDAALKVDYVRIWAL